MDWTRGRTIGRGSSATVSSATTRNSGETFAVKSFELCQSQFLQREQKILSSLSSPHVVGYIGYEITEENTTLMYNLMMEYLPGGTIADAAGRDRQLNEQGNKFYTKQIVQGLEYIHSCGIAHCDIKGRNILIGEKSEAKIADFGCARWLNTAEEDSVPIGGTPMYFAPEVARGEEQGYPADIWALGCTVIEMATGGGMPWTHVHDPVSVLHRIGFSEEIPEFPSFLSDEGKDFLSKCLRRDPKERWTAKQLLKHPFLGESNFVGKQVLEFDSDSPTCVLDQGVWNSIEELAEPQEDNTHHGICLDSPAKRIGRSWLCSGVPNWRWDENWITIRSNNKKQVEELMDEIREKDNTFWGSVDRISEELEVEPVGMGN